jgi:hypothetical protein
MRSSFTYCIGFLLISFAIANTTIQKDVNLWYPIGNETSYAVEHIGKIEFEYEVVCVLCSVYILNEQNLNLYKNGSTFSYEATFSRPRVQIGAYVSYITINDDNYFLVGLESSGSSFMTNFSVQYTITLHDTPPPQSQTNWYILIGAIAIIFVIALFVTGVFGITILINRRRKAGTYLQIES